jgi:virginiamycin B lyase
MSERAGGASIEPGPSGSNTIQKEEEMTKLSRAAPACVASFACAVALLVAACTDTAENPSSNLPQGGDDTTQSSGTSTVPQGTNDTTQSSAPSAEPPHGGKVVASIAIHPETGGLAVGEGAVWALSWGNWTLARIDPAGNDVAARITVKPKKPCPPSPSPCGNVAAGNGAVWVSLATDNTVARIDPKTNSVAAHIPVGRGPQAIATSPGAVWVANAGGPSISRIDPKTNKVVATIRVGPAGACCDRMTVTAGGGAVWATVTELGTVVRIDPRTNKVSARIKLPWKQGLPCGLLAANQGAVWAAGAHCASSSGSGVVMRIDPRTNRPTRAVTGFEAPIGLGLAFGSVWVADLDLKEIDRIDPRTGRIVARLPVGGLPILLEVGFGSVWVRDDTGLVLRIKPQR